VALLSTESVLALKLATIRGFSGRDAQGKMRDEPTQIRAVRYGFDDNDALSAA
jgi:hypothetical protein